MYDVAVIGGGILGVATARELIQRQPRLRVVLLEKERDVAVHQSGHNSGVIHSGIYYAAGSLKARLCTQGARAMRNYCESKAIACRDAGKLIVAVRNEELPALDELHRRGIANGVEGLRMLEAGEIREIEPHCRGIRALHSLRTGIVDYAAVTRSLADDVRAAGGEICTGHAVMRVRTGAREIALRCANGAEVVARRVIACAGLHADRIARLTGDDPEPRIVPFRGDYLLVKPERRQLD